VSDVLYQKTYIRMSEAERPVVWVGSSRRDLREFPSAVRRDIGRALYAAQDGETDPAAKPMRGFGGGSIVEIIANHRGDTWRAVYTVRFAEAIYVLHAFQKKSKHGIATIKHDIELIRRRLAEAERLHRERQN
jgi:phage-related protein